LYFSCTKTPPPETVKNLHKNNIPYTQEKPRLHTFSKNIQEKAFVISTSREKKIPTMKKMPHCVQQTSFVL